MDDIVPTIEVLSDGGRTVRTLTNIPEPVTGCMATTLGSKLLLIGGQRGCYRGHSGRVQQFDTATMCWTDLRSLPVKMSNGLLIHTQKRIHVFGGFQSYDVEGHTNDVEAIMDPHEGHWIARRSPWNMAFGAALLLN